MTTQLKQLVEELGNKYLPPNANDISRENSTAWIASVIDGDINTANIQSGRDVYDLLETEEVQDMASRTDLIALFTCGWASPRTDSDDDDLPPSQHPERKRVAMLVFANKKKQLVTAMRMGDNELLVNDDGSGALGDALISLMGD